MKIKMNSNVLQKVLKGFKSVNTKSLELEAQKGLLIIANDDIKLVTNNTNVQMESNVPGTILDPGKVILPESTVSLLEHFKDDEVIITKDTIIHGAKELKYNNNLPVEDFKYFNKPIDTFLFETTEKELDFLLGVHYATDKNDARPILEGINIRNNKFIALSGTIASMREASFNIDENLIIIKPMWETLRKTTNKRLSNPVKAYWDGEKYIKFTFRDYDVIGELMDDEFMEVSRLIPDNPNTEVIVNGNDLIKSVTLMEKLKSDNPLVDLIINESLTLETRTIDNILTDLVPAEISGQPLTIRFDTKLFSKVIKQYKGDKLTIEFTKQVGPGILKSNQKLEIIMPVWRTI